MAKKEDARTHRMRESEVDRLIHSEYLPGFGY